MSFLGVDLLASGGWLGASPGATPGQTLRVMWPGGGGQPEGWACDVAAMADARARRTMDFMLRVLVETKR
jgi:hypothetical protein